MMQSKKEKKMEQISYKKPEQMSCSSEQGQNEERQIRYVLPQTP